MQDRTGRTMSSADRAEWNRMNSENARAAQSGSATGNGSAAVTRGDTGRGQR